MAPGHTACDTCKLRHIKCDGGRPICNRCRKSRRVCTAAKDAEAGQFHIHSENEYASGQVQRPRGPRSGCKSHTAETDLEGRAIRLYLQDFVQSKEFGGTGGLSECLRAWRASGRESQLVDLAVLSIALAIFSKTRNHPESGSQALTKYDRLLAMVKSHIRDPTVLGDSEIDASLLTIFLMGRFETMMHSKLEGFNHSSGQAGAFSHHDGVMGLLKVWHDRCDNRSPSTIVKLSRRGQLRSCLLRDRRLPVWLHPGEDFGENELDLDYDSILVRIIQARCNLTDLEAYEVERSANTDRLEAELENLDEALCKWADSLPPHSRFQMHAVQGLRNLPTRHFYCSTVYSFTSISAASIWVNYFSISMLLISTRYRTLGLCGFHSRAEQKRRVYSALLNSQASNLASTIPFCLQQFSIEEEVVKMDANARIKPYLAGLVIWSLTLASCLEGIDSGMQNWFRSELIELGRITGDGMLQNASIPDRVPLR